MDQHAEKIEKRRRIQVGIYVLHLGLLIAGLVYFVLIGETVFAIVAGLLFLYTAGTDLLDETSALRAPIDKLGIRSIDRDLRGLDWLMIGLLIILTAAEGIALIIYEPSRVWALPVWVPFFLTAALAPLIVFGWMFDRSSRGVLFTFVQARFRFPPPEDEFWDEVRVDHQEIRDVSLVYVSFLASVALQFLMVGMWSGSTAMLVLWGILVTSVLKGVLLTRKADPVPFPPSS